MSTKHYHCVKYVKRRVFSDPYFTLPTLLSLYGKILVTKNSYSGIFCVAMQIAFVCLEHGQFEKKELRKFFRFYIKNSVEDSDFPVLLKRRHNYKLFFRFFILKSTCESFSISLSKLLMLKCWWFSQRKGKSNLPPIT